MIMKGLVGVTLLLAGPAFAADLDPRRPVKAPPAAPVYNWTGFYIGGNLGGVLISASGTSDFVDTFDTHSNPQHNTPSKGGLLGGVQAGYNWQFSHWGVLGIEGDWDWAKTRYSFCRQTDITSDPCDDNGDGFEAIGSRLNWLATVRARVGVLATPWLLLYGTGGAAWGHIETTLSQNCLDHGCGDASVTTLAVSSSAGSTRSGWVAGIGGEAMLSDHWSFKGEWLHVDLGTLSNALSSVGDDDVTGRGVETTTWSRREKFDEFRAGINYKF